ncbi:MAG TPA: PKD domain-containing protein [Solirubrobacterales bacterium]|nr:PKD domain-containing protein [Solirubrobacterales bacterium]
MRSKIFGALLIALATLAAWATPATAVITGSTSGRVSYLPLNEAATLQGAAPKRFTPPTGAEPPLVWHGGPVMHSQESFAIFWAPSGFAFLPGYTAAIEDFLKNVAADSGRPTNVYSVSAQYDEGGTGHATYSDSYGGSVIDTHAYPTSGTCPPYSGFGESFTACISDERLEEEVQTVVGEEGWPHGLAAEYYVVLPPEAGSCIKEGGEFFCFDEEFCAYHSVTSAPQTVYANISYSPGDPEGCGVEEYPNGHANGNVDDTLSSLSHEANESITDPTLEAWFDEAGFENGDECRNSSDDYGVPLGGPADALFNQSIGTGSYYLQREWSNDIEDCAQRVEPATPAIADPGLAVPGQTVAFNGGGSLLGSGGIVSYEWDFGDGGTASGENPSHAFAQGAFNVTLTVKDDGGFEYSTSRKIEVFPLLAPVVSTGDASGVDTAAATLNGSVDPGGRDTTYRFEYGTTTAYGSSVSGAAGAEPGARAVTANLTGLAPATTYHYRLVATNAVGPASTADATFTTSSSASVVPPQPPPPPPPPGCKVPKLVGKTLVQAKAALVGAGCKLGIVTRPRAKKGHRPPPLVVKVSTPGAGAEPANGMVGLKLGPKPKPKRHRHHR